MRNLLNNSNANWMNWHVWLRANSLGLNVIADWSCTLTERKSSPTLRSTMVTGTSYALLGKVRAAPGVCLSTESSKTTASVWPKELWCEVMTRVIVQNYLRTSKANHKIPDIVPSSQRIPRHRAGTGSPGWRFLRIGSVPGETRLVRYVGRRSERDWCHETMEQLREVSRKPRGLGADAAVHSRWRRGNYTLIIKLQFIKT